MASIHQDPFFLVLLDISNTYDTFKHGRILNTLEVWGTGLKLCGILVGFG